MGFYAPSQLVQDARRHGIEVRAVDVLASDWDCTLEDASPGAAVAGSPGRPVQPQPAVRLGLRLVDGLGEACAQRIMQARAEAVPKDLQDLALRAQLGTRELNALAAADAFAPLAGHRRQQVWQAAALQPAPELLRQVPTHEDALVLPPAPEGEDIVFDYRATGLTLRRHPLELLRPRLGKLRLQTAAQLHDLPHGRLVRACGIVTMRQQPQTAKGTIFVTLEDETGPVNVIVWKTVREKQRSELLHSRLLAVYGVWQRSDENGKEGAGEVRHLIAHHLRNLTPLLGRLGSRSRDFR